MEMKEGEGKSPDTVLYVKYYFSPVDTLFKKYKLVLD